ncbi:hypothetical protein [Bifidobacterium eulemuris]|uniref:Uncharacterized protein n=1 Tax=Bifidobacterium eulemuris TaxID=1765219 RepID=A0A261G9X2_9BIFI|nr:hypothetical protein [Bifidobacterium eulemuris]OZG68210.1 hypothetical protein BEUL_1223 [Bifidobacterium eulemuris]QOL31733.1 hypothetical protein BE0216_04075 [Bifidobacterium eulemuris]
MSDEPIAFEALNESEAAKRCGMSLKSFKKVYGDLCRTPVDLDGRELRMKQYSSVQLAQRFNAFKYAEPGTY